MNSIKYIHSLNMKMIKECVFVCLLLLCLFDALRFFAFFLSFFFPRFVFTNLLCKKGESQWENIPYSVRFFCRSLVFCFSLFFPSNTTRCGVYRKVWRISVFFVFCFFCQAFNELLFTTNYNDKVFLTCRKLVGNEKKKWIYTNLQTSRRHEAYKRKLFK